MSKIKTAIFLLRDPKRFIAVLLEKSGLASLKATFRGKLDPTNRQGPREFYFSIKNRIKYRYKNRFGRTPNLKNPTLFTEKVQWHKLYCPDIKKIAQVTNKASVYDYVRDKISPEHLLPIIWLGSSITPEDIRALGDGVVLQPTHRSGQVVFIEKQEEVDAGVIAEQLNIMLKWPYSMVGQEPWYGYSKPEIIARPLIRNSDGSPYLNDCKFDMYKQKDGTFKIVCQIANTYPHWLAVFDHNFERLPFDLSHNDYPAPDFDIPRPSAFSSMVRDAKALAADFDYVRVDFMLGANEYYFTELTFAPAGGHREINPPEWDEVLGSYWNLDTGSFLKRTFWFFLTWAPLWKTEMPIRWLRQLHRQSAEIFVGAIKKETYSTHYQRLKSYSRKLVLGTSQVGVSGTLASTNFIANHLLGFRRNGWDAVCAAFGQGSSPKLSSDVLAGELLYTSDNTARFSNLLNESFDCFILFPHVAQNIAFFNKSEKSKILFLIGESFKRNELSASGLSHYVAQASQTSDGLLVVSNKLKEEWQFEGYNKPIIVVRTPVDALAWPSHKGSSTGHKVAYFGNLSHKEIQNLLSIAHQVCPEIPDFQLDIYGDAKEATIKNLAGAIRAKDLESCIKVHKAVSTQEMRQIQSYTDVLLLPREQNFISAAGFPNKLGEYLASGAAVICTQVGEIDTVIKHKEHAILVESGDNNLFAQSLIALLKDRDESRAMGARGRSFISDYASPERVGKMIIDWAEREIFEFNG